MIKLRSDIHFTYDSNDQLLTLLDSVRFGTYCAIVYKIEWDTYRLEIPGAACVRIVFPMHPSRPEGVCHSCHASTVQRIRPISIEEMLTYPVELVRIKAREVLEVYPWLADNETHYRKVFNPLSQ